VPSDPGLDLVQDDPPFVALQFTVDEVQSVLLELDVSKGSGPDVILHPLLRVQFLFFLTDLYRNVFFTTGGHLNLLDAYA
jgi:hypothetical protein